MQLPENCDTDEVAAAYERRAREMAEKHRMYLLELEAQQRQRLKESFSALDSSFAQRKDDALKQHEAALQEIRDQYYYTIGEVQAYISRQKQQLLQTRQQTQLRNMKLLEHKFMLEGLREQRRRQEDANSAAQEENRALRRQIAASEQRSRQALETARELRLVKEAIQRVEIDAMQAQQRLENIVVQKQLQSQAGAAASERLAAQLRQ